MVWIADLVNFIIPAHGWNLEEAKAGSRFPERRSGSTPPVWNATSMCLTIHQEKHNLN
jgi:hypothetical protein